MKSLYKRYLAYLFRWQLSTPILAVCIIWFADFGTTWGTIIANLIGGLIFFWVDRFIFNSPKFEFPIWTVRHEGICDNCKKYGRLYRLVKYKDYDRVEDKNPLWLCEKCSKEKYENTKIK